MLKQQARTFEGLARAADLGAITFGFLSASLLLERLRDLRGSLGWIPGRPPAPALLSSDQYALLFISSLAAWVLISQWRGTYTSTRTDTQFSVFKTDLITQLLWILSVGYVAFFLKLTLLSRFFLLAFLPFAVLSLNLRLVGTRLLVRFFRARGFNLRDVAVIGSDPESSQFGNLLKRDPTSGYRVFYRDTLDADEMMHSFDELFVLANAVPRTHSQLVHMLKQGKRVHLVPCLLDGSYFRRDLNEIAGVPVLSLGGYGLSRPEAFLKRAVDIVGSLFFLLIFAPVFVLLAVVIKLSSRGPVFFRQERLGEGGKRFRIYKFRSMKQDAEEILRSDSELYSEYLKNNFKLPKGRDPRVTRIGRFLRSSSLDELPQLFNVLTGDMSLVGPRPVVPPEVDRYGEYARLFLCVKPGLTGNWQINGRAAVTDYSDRAALDIEYIRDQSLRTDVDILLKTIPAVLLRRGAH
jgi:exopolysaccharide biosynthesis polyprenyl glycosylphosphotransferase